MRAAYTYLGEELFGTYRIAYLTDELTGRHKRLHVLPSCAEVSLQRRLYQRAHVLGMAIPHSSDESSGAYGYHRQGEHIVPCYYQEVFGRMEYDLCALYQVARCLFDTYDIGVLTEPLGSSLIRLLLDVLSYCS